MRLPNNEHDVIEVQGTVYIDKGIWPLIKLLWSKGYKTLHCCENNQGQAYINFASVNHCMHFQSMLIKHSIMYTWYERKDKALIQRSSTDKPIRTCTVRFGPADIDNIRKAFGDEN